MERRTLGLLLVTAGTLLWSTAGLFVRLIDLDVWSLVAWRSLFAGVVLCLIALLQPRRGDSAFGLPGLVAVLLAATSMVAYVAALTLTSVANVLAIYATLPFVAAGFARLLLGERSSPRVLVASLLALLGVLIVAGLSLRPADVAGNALSLLMTVSFAALLVWARRHPGLDLARVNASACLLCGLAALPFMAGTLPTPQELGLLAALGLLTTALAYLLFLLGGRHIPAAEAGLIGLLDTVLGPLWVWMAFAEDPGRGALLGGAVILGAVGWYLLPLARRRPRPAA